LLWRSSSLADRSKNDLSTMLYFLVFVTLVVLALILRPAALLRMGACVSKPAEPSSGPNKSSSTEAPKEAPASADRPTNGVVKPDGSQQSQAPTPATAAPSATTLPTIKSLDLAQVGCTRLFERQRGTCIRAWRNLGNQGASWHPVNVSIEST
jgi:hypothetical protein